MSTAGAKPTNLVFTKYTVKSGVTVTKYIGVKYDTATGTIDLAAAGDKVIGVAYDTVLGDGNKRCEVALLAGAGSMRVKCSNTATQGEYAIAGTNGFENLTAGGGTTVRHCAGWFCESGITGDMVEMVLLRMPAVSA